MTQVIEERIETYKRDLSTLSNTDIVRRHILQDECYCLTNTQHFKLKRAVSNEFGLHTTEVHVVGSAKLGFGIAPRKLYRHFSEESDVDVVIVSPQLFDEISKDVYEYWRTGGYWERQRDFEHYLFRGWIRPDKLPPSSAFQRASDWWDFFRRLTESGEFGPYKITGALYSLRAIARASRLARPGVSLRGEPRIAPPPYRILAS